MKLQLVLTSYKLLSKINMSFPSHSCKQFSLSLACNLRLQPLHFLLHYRLATVSSVRARVHSPHYHDHHVFQARLLCREVPTVDLSCSTYLIPQTLPRLTNVCFYHHFTARTTMKARESKFFFSCVCLT